MQNPEFTDEELMAYADGELAEDRATELDLALAESPALADRLALFVDTRAVAREVWTPALEDPVPAHLVEHVRALAAEHAPAAPEPTEDTVVSFPRPTRGPKPTPFWQLPLAAGLALAIGLGAGLSFGPGPGSDGAGIQIAALTDERIVAALNTLPSGEDLILDEGGRIAPIATFFDGADTLCREFEFDRADGMTVVSVACQHDGNWDVQMAVAASAASETGYAPASSLDVLDAYLRANEAGPPLEPDAEAEALNTLR